MSVFKDDVLSGQVALVTGASRVLGAAIAYLLGQAGAIVIGTATSSTGAQSIDKRFADAGVSGRGLVLDLGQPESIAAALDDIAGLNEVAVQHIHHVIGEQPLGEAGEVRDIAEEDGDLGGLANARNPLDITPMAPEEVYDGAIRVMLEADEVDAVVVGIVPLTAALKTAPEELDSEGSLVDRIPRLFAEAKKPMIVVVDSGSRYEPLVRALRAAGIPVFPSADQAIRSLGRYLCHRAEEASS